MPKLIQAQAYSELYQRFKMQFLVTIVNNSRDVLRWSYLRKTFSGTHYFQPFTIYTKRSILDVPLCSEYASGTINYFCNRLDLDVWLGFRYTSRHELGKTFKGVIFRNAAAKTKKLFLTNFWKKLYWEIISQLFSASFCNIYRKTPVSEYLFDKVVSLQLY